jgi:hypothetical protein
MGALAAYAAIWALKVILRASSKQASTGFGMAAGTYPLLPYCRQTNTKTRPVPDGKDDMALPRTAPGARVWSVTFMA